MSERSFERKFVGGVELESFALAWLEHACVPHDDYADEVIHSIYYDTPDLRCYHEKVNGDFIKTKVRLRWYEGAGGETAAVFLEVKRKAGGSRGKKRIAVAAEREWVSNADLGDPGFSRVLLDNADVGELPPVGLLPCIHLRYRRHRFVCPASGAGVALDTAIGVSRVNSALIPGMHCANIPHFVVEVKGDGRGNPPWMTRLYDAGLRSRSFSKYAECVGRLIREEV